MGACPVCGREIQNTVCSVCGFDKSFDFEHYSTLSEVKSSVSSISNLKKTYEENQKKYLSCKNCGGKAFYIDKETYECICTQCSKTLAVKYQDTKPPQKQNEHKNLILNENVTNATAAARELLNLCRNQKGEEKQKTVEKIKELFERYSFNSELAVLYAKALENFSLTQNSKEKALTASELENLHEKFKYNELIAFIYAETLVSMSVVQDYSEKQKTVNRLKSLRSRFRDSEKISAAYAYGLRNLSRDQNIRERQETLLTLKELYESFINSEEIAVVYAMTLVNICKFQKKTNLTYSIGTGLFPKKESIDCKVILKNLRTKFPQNRSIRQCAEEADEMSRY